MEGGSPPSAASTKLSPVLEPFCSRSAARRPANKSLTCRLSLIENANPRKCLYKRIHFKFWIVYRNTDGTSRHDMRVNEMLALGQFQRKFYRVYVEFRNKLNRTYPNGSVRRSSTLSSRNVSSFLLIRETRKYIKQKSLTRKIVNLQGVFYANFQRQLDLRIQSGLGWQ